MARPRKQVQVSAAWARRNARARDLGYQSYYDYRQHNYGKQPAAAPRATGDQAARLRGHRGRGAMVRLAGDGDVANVNGSSERDSKGRFSWVDISIYPATGGKPRVFRLSGRDMQTERLRALLDQLANQGVVITLVYPPDLWKG